MFLVLLLFRIFPKQFINENNDDNDDDDEVEDLIKRKLNIHQTISEEKEWTRVRY